MRLVNKDYNFKIEFDVELFNEFKNDENLSHDEAVLEYIEILLENLKYDLLDESKYELEF